MTKRDFWWFFSGWLGAGMFVLFVVPWWQDMKTGVKKVAGPPAMYSFRESYEDSEREKIERQVDRMVETRSQLKATEDIQEAKFIQHWSAVERKLKALQAELNKTNQALEQHKREHEVLVASKPLKSPERVTVESGQLSAKYVPLDTLPPIKLMQLAKEVGFKKVEVR